MISFWKAAFLFFGSISLELGPVICVIYVENGKNLTINPDMKGTPEDILWTFNGNKVAEHDLNELQEYGQFQNRTKIDFSTGQLTVHQMTSKDSGVYKSVIQVNGMLKNSEDVVHVIDAVPEPDVTCKLNSTVQLRVLFCSVEIQIQTTFKWTGPNVFQHSQQTLYIGKDVQPESVYTCTVENPVSQNTNSITLQDCITDGSDLRLKIILPIIICVFVIVFGAAIYIICQIKNKGKKIPFNKEEGKMLLENSKQASGNQFSEDINKHGKVGHDAVENKEQNKSEARDQFVNNNKGAEIRNQEMETDENAKCAAEKISSTNEIQDPPEQMHESGKDTAESSMKDDNSEKNKEQEMNNDKGVSVVRDEKTVQMNKYTESKKCLDDDNTQQELNKTNSQDQSEQTHGSAENINKHVIDGHDAVENREQDNSEAGDQSVNNNKGADSRNQVMRTDENAKCPAEKISSTNEIQDPPEQHKSGKSFMKDDNSEKNEEQEIYNDKGVSMVRDEKTVPESKCSDDDNTQQELNKTNSQDQPEQTHESATEKPVCVKERVNQFENM